MKILISVKVVDLAEFDSEVLGVVRVDHQGNIRLPLAGRIQASGLTVEKLEKEVADRLSEIMNNPEVSVSVAEYRSHPASVLGAVRNSGVYQSAGRKTLHEVSLASRWLESRRQQQGEHHATKIDGTIAFPQRVFRQNRQVLHR